MKTFVLGGGCFWCLDSSYAGMKGVVDVTVGYAGGAANTANYDRVCDGNTGHAEVTKITFDESVISENVILDVFFTLHDPTQLNRQGNDVGTQYRSSMFYSDEGQRLLFHSAIEKARDYWDAPIVTTLEPLVEFFEAESYHQDYFAKNPGNGYCQFVVAPKVSKVRQKFATYFN